MPIMPTRPRPAPTPPAPLPSRSGVPPDAFSSTGQLWGSPLYDWKAQSADRYSWWVQRFERSLQLYDETRVDHFRAFAGYWAVEAWRETGEAWRGSGLRLLLLLLPPLPYRYRTANPLRAPPRALTFPLRALPRPPRPCRPAAMIGTWKKGPGVELFQALESALGEIPIMAEDLGVITPDVTALRKAIGAPGMCVLQFAWGGGPANTHLPHNVYENCFVYPGE